MFVCGIDFVCFCFATRQYNCSWNNTINQCQIFACGKKHGYFDSLLGLQMHTHTHTLLLTSRARESEKKNELTYVCVRESVCVFAILWLTDFLYHIDNRFFFTQILSLLQFSPSRFLQITYAITCAHALPCSRLVIFTVLILLFFFLFFHIRHNNL